MKMPRTADATEARRTLPQTAEDGSPVTLSVTKPSDMLLIGKDYPAVNHFSGAG